MRIISGEAKGRPLFAPSGAQTRPTSDKIRGALFNIIGSRVLDSRVLDLFGGSGALALEALSRGAESAVIVDNSRQAWQAIDRNARNVMKDDFDLRVRILKQDYRSAIAAEGLPAEIYADAWRTPEQVRDCIRQLYERLYNLDLIEKDPSRKLEFIPRKAEDRERHVIALDHQEVRELKDTVRRGTGLTQSQISHNRVNELRDDAIITLLLSTGIRVSECVGLDLEDVSLDKKTIRIIRKGRTKTQELHINDETALALFRYITEGRRPSAIDPEALFISKKGQRITVRSVQRLVRKYAKASGTDKKISCHKLRSTYGTNLYEATRDLNAVAERLGHASIETSRTYVRSSSDIDKENASLDIYSEHETGDTIGRPPHSK